MKRILYVLSILFSAYASQAQIINISISLDGPQAGNAGVTATGTGSATLDTGTRLLTLSGTYSGLSSTPTAAHIHGPAGVGVSAGVLQGISVDSTTSGNFSFSGTVDAATSSAIQAGNSYVNIHTVNFGGGEIRGQLTVVPEPETYALAMGVVALGFCGVRRFRSQTV